MRKDDARKLDHKTLEEMRVRPALAAGREGFARERQASGATTMNTTGNMGGTAVANGGILGRERIIAKTGFNRWLVPPAAFAIHLCIGMAYGFRVSWLPYGFVSAGALAPPDPADCASSNAKSFFLA
ncbi:MAG: hypothetical protein M3Z96_15085 [Pseudomonadota bacterium]|nr:hypothetical protein [Pseudomonadota bacterium]